jgi:hypothetical protein
VPAISACISVWLAGAEIAAQQGKLRIGQVTPFGIYARKDNYFTYGAGTRVQAQAAKANP